ncbi:diguanylate cyclase [Ideonella sp. DXS22W]|uniref:Diguanylate cyclase n=1 Tax=Pseudaquabacterium inlustre TaxID=2984192 RepID=A0ABU9CKL2_9BURK
MPPLHSPTPPPPGPATPPSLAQRIGLAWRAARAAWRQSAPAPTPPMAPPSPAAAPAPPVAGDGGLADLLAHSPDLVLHLDADGRVVGGNERAALHLRAALLPGARLRRLAAPGEWRRWLRQIRPTLLIRGVWAGETTLRLEGRHVPFALTVLAQRDRAGRWQGCTAVLRDLSADQAAHQQTQRQNQILSAITEALPATVVIVDSQGRYRYVNSAFERYAGRPAADIIGRTAGEVLGADEVARRRPFMKQAFAGEPVEFVLDYPTPEGTTWLALSCLPIKLDGVFDGFVGISQDITMQRREQERLAHLAERDPLTGLLNRAGFEQRVQQQRLQGTGDELALLYIDLDHFKAINDTLGHAAGDQVLQGVARRLQRAVRSTDLVCRLGGDEFAILLTGVCDRAIARGVGDKVLAAVGRPFELSGQTRHVGASIGVAVLPRAQASVAELLHEADARLYRAKAAGRGRQVGEDEPTDGAPAPRAAVTAVEPAPPTSALASAEPGTTPAAATASALVASAMARRAPVMPGAPGTPVAPPLADTTPAPH